MCQPRPNGLGPPPPRLVRLHRKVGPQWHMWVPPTLDQRWWQHCVLPMLNHTAAQNVTSSSSSISVTSSASRQRRVDLARAKRELVEARAVAAEARLEEIQADLEFAAGSQAGSVGRRLDDVQSEVGSVRIQSRDEYIDPTLQLLTDVALQQQPTTGEHNQFDGVFSPAREVTPSIYDVFSRARGVHIIDELLVPDGPKALPQRMNEFPSDGGLPSPSKEGMHSPTLDMSLYRVAFPSKEGAAQSTLASSSGEGALPPQGGSAQPTSVVNPRGVPSPPQGGMHPPTFGDNWFEEASPPQGGTPNRRSRSTTRLLTMGVTSIQQPRIIAMTHNWLSQRPLLSPNSDTRPPSTRWQTPLITPFFNRWRT